MASAPRGQGSPWGREDLCFSLSFALLGQIKPHILLLLRSLGSPGGVTGGFFLQGEYSGFVYSYAVEEPLAVVHKVAGYLPSLFWGFITLGRLISIPVSYRMKPATMVFINVVGVLITFLLLLIFSSSVVFLFVGTASLGLFLSSTFPSMLAYTEDILQYKGSGRNAALEGDGSENITRLPELETPEPELLQGSETEKQKPSQQEATAQAGCATTVLVTGAGIGEMVLQLLVGSIIHDRGSYSFLVCGMIFGCLAFTFYALLVFFHRMYPKPSPDPDPIPHTELRKETDQNCHPKLLTKKPKVTEKNPPLVLFAAGSSCCNITPKFFLEKSSKHNIITIVILKEK
ncbi:hypothetical protein IHE44_0008476 [Lamprotornis superbus]|uniref:Uncharacterized protein n=1 Tax=Lamprotornis superbus TaxID=245042 RepID=A0A835NP24_9PASS|nr:hypothetical protein IHE44_0008476 [Lamprotornis superbus]